MYKPNIWALAAAGDYWRGWSKKTSPIN